MPKPVQYELTDEQAADVRAKSGASKIFQLLYTDPVEKDEQLCIYVRRMSQLQHERYRAHSDTPERRLQAMRALVLGCAVSPERDAVEALIQERPALAETWALAIMEISGLATSTEKKAL